MSGPTPEPGLALPDASPAGVVEPPAPRPRPSNVLVVLFDDLGTEKVRAYGGEGPPTPTLSALADEGLLFRRAYASPQCSPTRANALTGRYGRRYGIGEVVAGADPWGLPPSEVLLPEALADAADPWATVALGKWHLHDGLDAPTHPNDHGFGHYSGALGNLGADRDQGVQGDFFHWKQTTDGASAWVDGYATTVTVDDAIAQVDTLPEPWFLWVALHAGHDPQHHPPADLLTEALAADAEEGEQYDAAVEAADAELGRLLDAVDPDRTTVVVFGDNGSAADFLADPGAGAKGTLYEPGIHVPLIVSGPEVAVPGSETDALVHAVDLYATVADLAGLAPDPGIDGASWRRVLADPADPGERAFVYAERFAPNGPGPYTTDQRTVSDGRFKLLSDELSGAWLLFDLDGAGEASPLDPAFLDPDAELALDALLAELERLRADVVLDPGLE